MIDDSLHSSVIFALRNESIRFVCIVFVMAKSNVVAKCCLLGVSFVCERLFFVL